jgi:uncharacterized membrane protein YheB (UPF0754 family)
MENLNVTETLKETVNSDSAMKTWLVNYVGEQCDPKDDKVTVEMIVETMAKEFPEFLMAIAEENWVRGYHQALHDVDTGRNAEKEELKENGEE